MFLSWKKKVVFLPLYYLKLQVVQTKEAFDLLKPSKGRPFNPSNSFQAEKPMLPLFLPKI